MMGFAKLSRSIIDAEGGFAKQVAVLVHWFVLR